MGEKMEGKIWKKFNNMSRRKLALILGIILAVVVFAPIYPAVLPTGSYGTSINGLASLSFLLSKQGFIILGYHLYWGAPLYA